MVLRTVVLVDSSSVIFGASFLCIERPPSIVIAASVGECSCIDAFTPWDSGRASGHGRHDRAGLSDTTATTTELGQSDLEGPPGDITRCFVCAEAIGPALFYCISPVDSLDIVAVLHLKSTT